MDRASCPYRISHEVSDGRFLTALRNSRTRSPSVDRCCLTALVRAGLPLVHRSPVLIARLSFISFLALHSSPLPSGWVRQVVGGLIHAGQRLARLSEQPIEYQNAIGASILY